MRNVTRELQTAIIKAFRGFPAVVLTGPRRAGKTWMLRHLFPNAQYHLFEDPDIIARVRSDPRGFFENLRTPVILDEVQNVPEVFSYVRSRIDSHPRRTGQWLLTGSQESPLMQGVAESMAGRAAVMQLLPFSLFESPKVNLLHGGFPEALARPSSAGLWFASYVQTYLERDVRAITAVKDLSTFRRFLSLVASRHGQVMNRTDIAAPLGVSVPTISQWLGILEITAQILLVPPFYESFGKRLVKSPKLYLSDSGLACHLLGIRTNAELLRSPFAGALFEGMIASEIVKAQLAAGRRRELYWFRDEQGLEVDFVFPRSSGAYMLAECKAGKTVVPQMSTAMLRLRKAAMDKGFRQGPLELVLVHQGSGDSSAISPGVRAVPVGQFIRELRRERKGS